MKYGIFNAVVDQPNENDVHSLLACKDELKVTKETFQIFGRGSACKKTKFLK